MRVWKWVAVFLLIAAPASADPAKVAKAHSEEFARAMEARDVKAVLELYDNDARVIWPGQGEEADGKAELEKLVINSLAQSPNFKLTLKSQDVLPLDDGFIGVLGQWEQSVTGPDGQVQIVKIRTSEVIKRRGARTVYIIDHASVGVPPPPPPPADAKGAGQDPGRP